MLVGLKFITEETMRQALCIQHNIPYINLDNVIVDRSLAKIINKKYAQKHQVVPIARIGDTLTLVMDDPTDTQVVKELEAFSGHTINVVTAKQRAIVDAFMRLYEGKWPKETDSQLKLSQEEAIETLGESKPVESQQNRRADALVTRIINMGLEMSTTDIHLETLDRRMLARFRIDGVLQDAYLGPVHE